jgi:sarcosine oxidase
LDAAEAMRRFPQFRLPDDYRVLHDHRAGLVLPEVAVAGHAELAMRRGAELHGHEPVTSWEADGDGVVVRTGKGTYGAARVIFCGGAWTDRLARDLGVPLTVTRQPQVWVWPRRPDGFELGRMPVWIMEHRDGSNHYGFPMLPDIPGLKVATHVRPAPTADVEMLDRSPRAGDEAAVRWVLRDHLPDANGPLLAVRVCMYTNSPDLQFILDRHPQHANVLIACGFSGHGFKCATAIGQALAEMAIDGRSTLPIGFLGLGRFVAGISDLPARRF